MFGQGNPPIPPFYSVHGGLFYPSHREFRSTFNSASDFIWGMSMGLPVSPDFLYIIGDISWFKSRGIVPDDPGTEAEVSYQFLHAGLLSKQFLSPMVAVRMQAGTNYNSVEWIIRPEGGEEIRNELSRKLGFFGGAGLETFMAQGKMSVFADFIYDYRRSSDRSFYGDFGGFRIVMGMSAYWF